MLPVAGDGNGLEPQINPYRLLRRNALCWLNLDRQTQPPVPDRILRKAAIAPFRLLQALALEHPHALASKAQTRAFAFEAGCFERDPAQRAPGAATHAPAQLHSPGGATLLGIVGADRLNRIGAELVKRRPARAAGSAIRACRRLAQRRPVLLQDVLGHRAYAALVGRRRRSAISRYSGSRTRISSSSRSIGSAPCNSGRCRVRPARSACCSIEVSR